MSCHAISHVHGLIKLVIHVVGQ